jgi:hypothetical protein
VRNAFSIYGLTGGDIRIQLNCMLSRIIGPECIDGEIGERNRLASIIVGLGKLSGHSALRKGK